MIDPNNIIDYNRTDEALEEFLLFAVLAAGKPAHRQATLLDALLALEPGLGPFDAMRAMEAKGMLDANLRKLRIGQYHRIGNCFRELVNGGLDLRTCSAEDLEEVYGIGLKTARMFLLYTRPKVRVACLDTHILRFMKEHLRSRRVPDQTPTSPKSYHRLERAFLRGIRRHKRPVAEVDLAIWRHYANREPLAL